DQATFAIAPARLASTRSAPLARSRATSCAGTPPVALATRTYPSGRPPGGPAGPPVLQPGTSVRPIALPTPTTWPAQLPPRAGHRLVSRERRLEHALAGRDSRQLPLEIICARRRDDGLDDGEVRPGGRALDRGTEPAERRDHRPHGAGRDLEAGANRRLAHH